MTTWKMSIVTSTWMTFKNENERKNIMALLDLCKVYFGSHDMMKYDKLNSFNLFFGTCFFFLENIWSFSFFAYHLRTCKTYHFSCNKHESIKIQEKCLEIRF